MMKLSTTSQNDNDANGPLSGLNEMNGRKNSSVSNSSDFFVQSTLAPQVSGLRNLGTCSSLQNPFDHINTALGTQPQFINNSSDKGYV
jgi:hypothetical protein